MREKEREREGVRAHRERYYTHFIYIIVFRNKLFADTMKNKNLTQAIICYRIIDISSEKNDSFYCFYYSNNDDDGFELSC